MVLLLRVIVEVAYFREVIHFLLCPTDCKTEVLQNTYRNSTNSLITARVAITGRNMIFKIKRMAFR